MLQQDEPEDFVIATGEQHSVREFVQLAFKVVSINIKWVGEGINEKGVNDLNGEVIVEVDEKYYRPSEVESLQGNPSKAKNTRLESKKTKFSELVELMVKSVI